MKNQNIINAVLGIAVVVLFALTLFGRKASNTPEVTIDGTDSLVILPVAYVNVDSLLAHYQFAQELNDKMLRKTESAQATLNQKGRSLEADAQEFQKKLQNGAFFDRERAEKEQQRILKKQQDFEALQQKLAVELQQQQEEVNRTLRERIMVELKAFNDIHKHQIIFANAMNDNILYADKVYDVTDKLVNFLNDRYTPSGDSEE